MVIFSIVKSRGSSDHVAGPDLICLTWLSIYFSHMAISLDGGLNVKEQIVLLGSAHMPMSVYGWNTSCDHGQPRDPELSIIPV